MSIRDDLYHVRESVKDLISMEITLNFFNYNLKSIPISERVQKTPEKILEKNSIERIELEIRLENQKNNVIKLMNEVEKKLEILKPKERAIIRLYFFTDKTWEEVAEEFGYTSVHVKNISKDGIEKLLKAYV